MIEGDSLDRILGDNSLTDAARVLCIHMHRNGEEPREYRAEDLARLLHGYPTAQTVWRHVRQLEITGYVECVKAIPGQGHGKTYRALPLKIITGNEEYPGNISVVKPDTHENFQGKGSPSSTTTSTPSPTPISPPDGLEAVRQYVGELAVRTALASGVLPPVKLLGISGMYGPGRDGEGGTQSRIYGDLSPPERQQALTTAIYRFALDGKQFTNGRFESYLKRAISGEWKHGDDGINGDLPGGDGPRPRRLAAAARGAGGDPRQHWDIERDGD